MKKTLKELCRDWLSADIETARLRDEMNRQIDNRQISACRIAEAIEGTKESCVVYKAANGNDVVVLSVPDVGEFSLVRAKLDITPVAE